MTTNYLHSLNCKQLISILRHVQHGHEHLSHHLSRQEYRDLLNIGSLSYNQLARIESDPQEKIGNASIVVNTILTSCFGAWLGFNAFTEQSIISPFGIVIILLAFSFGSAIGYLSYLLTFKQAKLISKHQQLSNVERVIIEIIIHKRQAKIEQIKQKLFSQLHDLDLGNLQNQDQSDHRLFDLLMTLQHAPNIGKKNPLIKKALLIIKRNVTQLRQVEETQHPHEETSTHTDFFLNNALTNASYIKTLTKSTIVKKYHIPKVDNWLRRNFTGILVGLVPTFLGSFASMFVFLNGIPACCQGLGIDFHLSPSKIMFLKNMGLMTAVTLSLYFAYSHIHSNYKAFRRSKQLELSELKVADLANQMLSLISKISKWHKIFYQLQLIRDINILNSDTEQSIKLTAVS